MVARYIQKGESVDYIPDRDVAAGEVFDLNGMVGVAKLDIKSGELGALALTGVYEFRTANPKEWRDGVSLGQTVYYDTDTCLVWLRPGFKTIALGRYFGCDGEAGLMGDKVHVKINCANVVSLTQLLNVAQELRDKVLSEVRKADKDAKYVEKLDEEFRAARKLIDDIEDQLKEDWDDAYHFIGALRSMIAEYREGGRENGNG